MIHAVVFEFCCAYLLLKNILSNNTSAFVKLKYHFLNANVYYSCSIEIHLLAYIFQ